MENWGRRRTLKKIILVFWILIVSLGPVSAEEQELAELSFVCDPWAPYQIVNREERVAAGFSFEVVKIVCERAGIKIKEIKAFPWKRALMYMETGKYDAIFSINKTREREKVLRYPDSDLDGSIASSPWVMWVREDSGREYRDFGSFKKNKTKVGVVKGYSYTRGFWNFLENYQVPYEEVDHDEQNFLKLKRSEVDYIIAELANGMAISKRLRIDHLVKPIIKYPVKVDGLYVAFNRERVSEEVARIFFQELIKFKQEPGYQELHQKYFSVN